MPAPRGSTKIREYVPTDIGAVYRIGEACAPDQWGNIPDTREQIAAWSTDFFFVAEVEGAVVGFARGEVLAARDVCIMPEGTKYLEVTEMYVRPEFQRRGLGSALIAQLLKKARAAGITRFQVYTDSRKLDDALDFYRRAGFGTWHARLFI